MGSLSIWHWLIVLISFIVIIPFWKIVSKAGFSGAWCLLLFVPVVGFLMIWVFAFIDWPAKVRSDPTLR